MNLGTSRAEVAPQPLGGCRGTPGSARRAADARRFRTTRASRLKSASSSARDEADRARERFGELVAIHQRRALRIAYQYLRDAAEADEAVQDAFVKVFSHIGSYREAWPFEVWFTRILINGCLDRRKSPARRERWFTPLDEARMRRSAAGLQRHCARSDPEAQLLARERRARLAARSIASTAGSERCSCCATTATARRARSAR